MKAINPFLASLEDLDKLMELFDSCRQHMIQQGIFQWDDRYPARAKVAKDIEAKTVFILEDKDNIVASITLNEDQAEDYKEIGWKYKEGSVLVIHRLAVHPKIQGKAYGKKLCLFAEDWARKQQFQLIRLDAYSPNAAANRLYHSLGYHRADGLCYFHGNELPFYCYEKFLQIENT